MNRSEFISKFENLLEMPSGSISGSETLSELPGWDSLALMGFIALAHSALNVKLTGKQVVAAQTVSDLLNLCGDKLTA